MKGKGQKLKERLRIKEGKRRKNESRKERRRFPE
jgi:hypothetical protein